MLPDYPKTKSTIQQWLVHWIRRRVALYLGRLDLPNVQIRHEGDRALIHRVGESPELVPVQRASGEGVIKKRNPEELSADDSIKAADEIARQIAASQQQTILATVEGAADATGNVVALSGNTIAGRDILNMLARVPIDFDLAGTPLIRDFFIHPHTPDVERAWRELHESPGLTTELDALIARKRQEWDDREADRTLD